MAAAIPLRHYSVVVYSLVEKEPNMTLVVPTPTPESEWIGDYTKFPYYHGLRATSDEYFGLYPDGYSYELVHGIVMLKSGGIQDLFHIQNAEQPPKYVGLRLSADSYLALADDGYRYELIDGVVIMSPSPTPLHQAVMLEIAYQIKAFLRSSPIGRVLVETDVVLMRRADETDLVYRPELVFYRQTGGRHQIPKRLEGPPDLVVEVLSPATRNLDLKTKREDYEVAGVTEYWVVDPNAKSLLFLRMLNGKYEEVGPDGDSFASEAIPGFRLNITDVKAEWLLD